MKLRQAHIMYIFSHIHCHHIPSTTISVSLHHTRHTWKHDLRGKSMNHGSNQVIKTIMLSISLNLKSSRSSNKSLSLKLETFV